MLAFLTLLGAIGITHMIKTNQILDDIKQNQQRMTIYNNIAFHTVRSNAAIRGFMNYEEDFMMENHFSIREEVHASIDQLKQLGETSEDFTQFEADFHAWEQAIDEQVIPLLEEDHLEEALTASKPILGKGSKNLVEFSKENAIAIDQHIRNEITQMNKNGSFVFSFTIIMVIISVIIGATIAFVFGNRISKALQHFIAQTKKFTTGDFTITYDTNLPSEFGTLAISMNNMTDTLGETLQQISTSAEQVATTAQQLTANGQEVSRATIEIGESIQNISVGIDQQNDKTKHTGHKINNVSQETDQISLNILSVNEQVKLATEKANQGFDFAATVTDQMETILTNTNQITTSLHELEHQSVMITKIVSIISNIAEQTNLLALNASIEAARAGEHGKGFAVVATQVRHLAEQSGKAANEIHTLVETITSHTDQVVQAMESNNQSVQKGKEMVDVTAETFSAISEAVNLVQTETQNVTTAVHNVHDHIQSIVQDTDSIVQISSTFTDESQTVAAAIEQESAMMEEVAASANELSNLATQLQDSTKQFNY